MNYELSLKNQRKRDIISLGENFAGTSADGRKISFTNTYMEKDGKPFFGVSGEFHYSRMEPERWEDELIKMKLGGVGIIATYVFWNHHEEEEGVFRFDGRRDLRRFILLCKKHGLDVILRVGPFDHGEVRNGGLPDWLYGKPFEVRDFNEGFFSYTRCLYEKLGEQTKGLYFKDNGPIIGVQIENEYMHSSAGWEITTGISNEWVYCSQKGTEYMLALKQLAADCGLQPAFYTCTAWGGAPVADSMLPLWGGYAYRPWIFYSHKGEHPATTEYVYQDFHNNEVTEYTCDFAPDYAPESRPYACCEMGGGMTCCYYYRFTIPGKSVDAMANIKIASGCNFVGYYMFQGGTNPLGVHGQFLNESQVPRMSYDYQAALGEFGQVRKSYRRLKSIHQFVSSFGERLCLMHTVLPDGAARIDPKDAETLRYAVRVNGNSGFLFLNNFQDHFEMRDRKDDQVTLLLDEEELSWNISLAKDENAILPFHFDMDGIDLVQANAQPLTRIRNGEGITWVFFVPDGMEGSFTFEEGVTVDGGAGRSYRCRKDITAERFFVEKDDHCIAVLVLCRVMAEKLYVLEDGTLIFSDAAVLQDEDGVRLESCESENEVILYPASAAKAFPFLKKKENRGAKTDGLGYYTAKTAAHACGEIKVTQVGPSRWTLKVPDDVMDGVKDALLSIDYVGDIGNAFINGRMIHDNFSNGAVWEISLKEYQEELKTDVITVYIVPLKEGANVHVESGMAARSETVEKMTAGLNSAVIRPVYEIKLS